MEVTISLDKIRQDIKAAEENLTTLKAVEEYIIGHAPSVNGTPPKIRSVATNVGQAEIAEKALVEIGKPAKTTEIVDKAIEKGWITVTENRRNKENSMYSAMARNKNTFFIIERGTWELVSRKK